MLADILVARDPYGRKIDEYLGNSCPWFAMWLCKKLYDEYSLRTFTKRMVAKARELAAKRRHYILYNKIGEERQGVGGVGGREGVGEG
jgi:hypothetical protein